MEKQNNVTDAVAAEKLSLGAWIKERDQLKQKLRIAVLHVYELETRAKLRELQGDIGGIRE